MSRTYVVTGTASGIAAATSRMLKEVGNKVIGVDIHDADIVADLSTKQGRLDAAKKAIELSGGTIDAVIACAGLAHPIAKTVSVNYFGMTEGEGAASRAHQLDGVAHAQRPGSCRRDGRR
jgi:NAD(P)-dependent dehydrogenase (short-subunit alcohol dehydrogenase family)